jgi:septal ring factor EnvC (AmiA/AmiB activator)
MNRTVKDYILILAIVGMLACGGVIIYLTKTHNDTLDELRDDFAELKKEANDDKELADDYQGQILLLQEQLRQQGLIARNTQTRVRELEIELKKQSERLQSEKDRFTQLMADQAKKYQEEIASLILEHETRYGQLETLQKQTEWDRKMFEDKATRAVKVSESLTKIVNDSRALHETLQQRLETEQNEKRKVEMKLAEFNKKLYEAQAKATQLESVQRRNVETILALETENARLRQKYEKGKPPSGSTGVPSDKDATGGVPLRGEIVDIQGDLAAISLGSSDGVKQNMIFHVYRGDTFLGNLVVSHVESKQSAGKLSIQQGTIAVGDKVSSGVE